MDCCFKKPSHFLAIAIIIGLIASHFYPASKLTSAPPNPDAQFAAPWKAGCESGISSSSTIKAMTAKKPFVYEGRPADSDYRSAWNVGYTSCRYVQEGADRWIQTILIMAAFIFVCGLRKSNECK